MKRLTDADMCNLPMYDTEIEYQIALKESEKYTAELEARVARLQNHVIAADKLNAEMAAEIARLKDGAS